MYQITNYSYLKAKQLGVDIYPSNRKNKKIDVYKDDKYICSIGDNRYLDFPNFAKIYGLPYAIKRKELYLLRHHKDVNNFGTAGFFAYHILW